ADVWHQGGPLDSGLVQIRTTWEHSGFAAKKAAEAGAATITVQPSAPGQAFEAVVSYTRPGRGNQEPLVRLNFPLSEVALLVEGDETGGELVTYELRALHKKAMKLGGSHENDSGLVVSAFGKGTTAYLKLGR